jgi:protein-tyrosine phosphatase
MIDIHSHILSGLDDGATHMQESLNMARQAVSQGIHTVIATPHHANGRYSNKSDIIKNSVDQLNARLQEEQIPLQVLAGQEVRVYQELLKHLEDGELLSLDNSRYILLEFPSYGIPSSAQEVLYELQVMGKVPIIAHPERNQEIIKNPVKLLELVELGALSQVTAQSVFGGFGKEIQRLSLDLCKKYLTHFIASDAHNVTNRPFLLGQAYEVVNDKLSPEITNYFQNNALSVIENTSITLHRPEWPKHKWFHFWKSS